MTPSPDLLAVLREALIVAREYVVGYIDNEPGITSANEHVARKNLEQIDTALSAPEAQGRRPIADHPKEVGVPWLFWNPKWKFPMSGFWIEHRERFDGCGLGWSGNQHQPTHFMPLPPTPETTT